MKSSIRFIALVALQCLAACSASESKRETLPVVAAPASVPLTSVPSQEQAPPASLPARCEQASPGEAFDFHGQPLEATPDLKSDQLRRINALIDIRCRGEAWALLEQYRHEHPQDFQVAFVEARLLWGQGEPLAATQLLTATLSEHPEFSSAKVLLSALAIERGDVPQARKLLGELKTESPTDLWAMMHRLLLGYRLRETASEAILIEILRDPRFPSSARETAGMEVVRNPMAANKFLRPAYELQLGFESATPYWMKATNFARFLMEQQDDPVEARHYTDLVLNSPEYARGHGYAQLLKAESYLIEAAAISERVGSGNQDLVNKAMDLLDHDLTPIRERLDRYPGLERVRLLLDSLPGDKADG